MHRTIFYLNLPNVCVIHKRNHGENQIETATASNSLVECTLSVEIVSIVVGNELLFDSVDELEEVVFVVVMTPVLALGALVVIRRHKAFVLLKDSKY